MLRHYLSIQGTSVFPCPLAHETTPETTIPVNCVIGFPTKDTQLRACRLLWIMPAQDIRKAVTSWKSDPSIDYQEYSPWQLPEDVSWRKKTIEGEFIGGELPPQPQPYRSPPPVLDTDQLLTDQLRKYLVFESWYPIPDFRKLLAILMLRKLTPIIEEALKEFLRAKFKMYNNNKLHLLELQDEVSVYLRNCWGKGE